MGALSQLARLVGPLPLICAISSVVWAYSPPVVRERLAIPTLEIKEPLFSVDVDIGHSAPYENAFAAIQNLFERRLVQSRTNYQCNLNCGAWSDDRTSCLSDEWRIGEWDGVGSVDSGLAPSREVGTGCLSGIFESKDDFNGWLTVDGRWLHACIRHRDVSSKLAPRRVLHCPDSTKGCHRGYGSQEDRYAHKPDAVKSIASLSFRGPCSPDLHDAFMGVLAAFAVIVVFSGWWLVLILGGRWAYPGTVLIVLSVITFVVGTNAAWYGPDCRPVPSDSTKSENYQQWH